ncbi:hypothetical protein [Halomonas sp. M20]|uniref:hypothetical protein n=1 Tax=Halomonas sp. M20 TaxID=2763264 RepID=UPI001D0BC035|nr:hypothetical protein [Halomonas sp. M20]
MSSIEKLPKLPSGEPAIPALYDPQLRWAMLRSRWAYIVRLAFEMRILRPLEDRLFERWLTQKRFARQVEATGLPYRSVEAHLDKNLALQVDPNALTQLISIPRSFPVKSERRSALNQFIWKGEWDRTRYDFRKGSRYRLIDDIWRHQDDLIESASYRRLVQRIAQGNPFRSHQKGILLNTPDKVLAYLNVYIGYMKDMQRDGFDNTLGKDRLGVAIDRHGRVVKLNRGLHRLAMAQVLGLKTIPVQVRSVHARWWFEVTSGERGEAALMKMVEALRDCRPAS